MLYECLNPECLAVFQSRYIPSVCPQCGGAVLQSVEDEGDAIQAEYSCKDLVKMGLSLFSSRKEEEQRCRAYGYFREAAQKRDPEGLFYLGLCFELGYGVKTNLRRAVHCYQASSDLGYHTGTCSLAYCYLNGIGVEENAVKAAELYRKAAESGNLRAQTNLGVSYSKGIGVEYDPQKAFLWYYVAAEFGYKPAMLRLAACYKNGFGVRKNPSEALRLYRMLENDPEPEPEALIAIGLFYESGEANLPKDGGKAWGYYSLAASYGSAEAQWRMGRCCEHAIGVKWNMDLAMEYYTQAARGGCAEAQNELGKCYEFGRSGVKSDPSRAFAYYRLAALHGLPEGIFQLGRCYEKGVGTCPDVKHAAYFYQRASQYNNQEAQYSLAKAYRYGRGIEKDRKKAFYWMRRSANNGSAKASVLLGRWYFHQNDLIEAIRCFHKFERQTGGKSACSCFYLGRCHLKGTSGQDREKAISLLKMAEAFRQEHYSKMASDLLKRLQMYSRDGPPIPQEKLI